MENCSRQYSQRVTASVKYLYIKNTVRLVNQRIISEICILSSILDMEDFIDFLFIVTLIMGVCNCSMFCCTLLYVHSSIAIILMGKRELVALLNLSSWCLVMVERLFLAMPRGCLRFVIVVFPDHTHLLFLLVHACLQFEFRSIMISSYFLFLSSGMSHGDRERRNIQRNICSILSTGR